MNNETKNVVKQSILKIQDAIDLLKTIKGSIDEIDEVCDELSYKIADLEFEINN